jgi:hypothetical protein
MRKTLEIDPDCLKYLKNSVFIFIRQQRRLENLNIFSVIGGDGGSAARLTPLSTRIYRYTANTTKTIIFSKPYTAIILYIFVEFCKE